MKTQKKVALVTGANRGIGFEICRQLAQKGCHVILTSRNEDRGKKAVQKLREEGLDEVVFSSLDVCSDSSCDRLADWLKQEYGNLDILVNNAGVMLDSARETGRSETERSILHAKIETIRDSLETNTFGAIRLTQRVLPLMLKRGYGRIVNVSSGMGQLSEMNGGWPGYRISKTALNAVTRIFADEVRGSNILINSACPGWVKTDMGGPEAELTPREGADTIVWLATLPEGGPTGGFFRERKPIDW